MSGEDTQAPVSTSSLSSINAQLLGHGWIKRPLNLDALAEKDMGEVVGVLFELLGQSVTHMSTLEALSGRHRTLTYEHERTLKSIASCRAAQSRLEAETTSWKARCADAEKRMTLEEHKVRELREDVARARRALDGVRLAAGHEAKKNQNKLDKMQTQLLKVGNDAAFAARPNGLSLLNPIPTNRSAPAAPTQPLLLEQSIKDLSEIRHSLQEETEAFRHVVVSTGNGLREALAIAEGNDAPARMGQSQFFSAIPHAGPSRSTPPQTGSSTSHPSLADARLKALLDDVRTKLADKAHRRVVVDSSSAPAMTEEEIEAQKAGEREKQRAQQDLEDRVKDLEVEVNCARARELEAKRLVEEFARAQAEAQAKAEADGRDVEDEDAILSLAEQKQVLDEERRRFAAAMAQVEQDKRRLEAERQIFLEERRRAEEDALFGFLPGPEGSAASGIDALNVPKLPTSPGPMPGVWDPHRPMSPSPLSPGPKASTPKVHKATNRRKSAKTPLSRLVLEKAVRQKAREEVNVLGEDAGRRTNARVSDPGSSGVNGPAGPNKKGLSASPVKRQEKLEARTTGRAGPLKSSTLKASLAASVGPAKRTLSQAGGPAAQGAAAARQKAWR